MYFEAQIIFSPEGRPVGIEILSREVEPKQHNDIIIVHYALETVTLHRDIFSKIPPHINVFCETLEHLYLLRLPDFSVVFEVVERNMDVHKFRKATCELKEKYPSLRFAVDDFGSGANNFSLLSQASDCLDIVKLDAEVLPCEFIPPLVKLWKKKGKTVYIEKNPEILQKLGKIIRMVDGIQNLALHVPEPLEHVVQRLRESFSAASSCFSEGLSSSMSSN